MAIKRANRTLLTGLLAVAQLALASSVALTPAASAQDTKVRPHIDLAFCIDTTGSMQSEIDNVKAKTKEIVAKLAGGKPSPVIRVGLVAYRDRGDEYVTKVFPFTEDIDKMVRDISGLQANGGGDTPEAVNEALHSSVHDLAWSSDKKTLKLLFLIGDAGPKHYPNDYDWHTEARQAIASGIEINTLGCQGLETCMPAADGVDVFKEIAHLADGKYEPLSYRHEIAEAGGKRSTLVSSGGSLYKVAGAAGADWHEGAAKLAAEGRAERMAAPAFTGGMMMETAAAAPAGMALRSAKVLRGAPLAAPMAASAPVAGYAMTSRDENNLADLVLQATKDAAKKQLKVDFKEK